MPLSSLHSRPSARYTPPTRSSCRNAIGVSRCQRRYLRLCGWVCGVTIVLRTSTRCTVARDGAPAARPAAPPRTRSAGRPAADAPGAAHTPAPRSQPPGATATSRAAAAVALPTRPTVTSNPAREARECHPAGTGRARPAPRPSEHASSAACTNSRTAKFCSSGHPQRAGQTQDALETGCVGRSTTQIITVTS